MFLRKPWKSFVLQATLMMLACVPPGSMAQGVSSHQGTASAAAAAQKPETKAPAPAGGAAFVAQGLGRATVSLTGLWAFHPGDDRAWAAPGYDDASWPRIETGKTWEERGFRNLTGFAWYRRKIVVDAGANPDWTMALMLPSVQDAAEVYWNGRLVGSYGKVPPDPVWYDQAGSGIADLSPHQPAYVPLGRPESGVLAIRVWKAPYVFYSFENEGGLTGVPLLGSATALVLRNAAAWYAWLQSDLYGLGLALVSGIVALLALLAWFRDRKQWMLFWLALYTVHPLALLPITDFPGLVSFRWGYGLVAPVICVEDVALWFLLLYLLNLRDDRRLVRWTIWMSAIAVVGNFGDGALQLFHWTTWPGHLFLSLDVGITIPALVVEAWGVLLVLFAFRKRLDGARWFLAITAMLADLLQAMGNWFSLGVRWTHWTFWEPLQKPLFAIGPCPFGALTIMNTLLLVAIVYAVWRYQAEQSRKQGVLDEEYRNAQELQQVLVPESLPEVQGYRLSSAYRPAQVVGGDFFQIMPVKGATLAVVGDVSGKGLKAAMMVALIVGALRSLAETTGDPARLLEGLNRRLHGRMEGGFATCLAVRLEASGECVAANAGHIAPLLNGEEVGLPGALPLGMVDAAEYTTTRIRMRTGDRLTLYTDGLPEARSAEGELYGFERVQALVAAEPDAETVAAAAVEYGQEDDVTVVTVIRDAPDQEDEFRVFQEMVAVTAGRRREGRE
jgi:hypothetical protein